MNNKTLTVGTPVLWFYGEDLFDGVVDFVSKDGYVTVDFSNGEYYLFRPELPPGGFSFIHRRVSELLVVGD